MFMGTMQLIAKHVVNNNSGFFKKFTSVRGELEKVLIEKKDLLSTIIQRHISGRRANVHATVLEFIVDNLAQHQAPNDAELVSIANLEGKIVVGTPDSSASDFSEDVQSKAFIGSAIATARSEERRVGKACVNTFRSR